MDGSFSYYKHVSGDPVSSVLTPVFRRGLRAGKELEARARSRLCFEVATRGGCGDQGGGVGVACAPLLRPRARPALGGGARSRPCPEPRAPALRPGPCARPALRTPARSRLAGRARTPAAIPAPGACRSRQPGLSRRPCEACARGGRGDENAGFRGRRLTIGCTRTLKDPLPRDCRGGRRAGALCRPLPVAGRG